MRHIIIRQLAIKEDVSSSWVAMVRKLLRTYGLASAYTLLENTPIYEQKAVEEGTGCSDMEPLATDP